MSYHVIVVPRPLKPNKRVRVEVPDKLSAKDAKHAIERSLLAKYGRAAPCQQQHVRHDQHQAVVENDQAPYRETMGWGVQESLQNMMSQYQVVESLTHCHHGNGGGVS